MTFPFSGRPLAAALFVLAAAGRAWGGTDGTYSFEEIWGLVKAHSPSLSGARHERDAARDGETGASLQRVPRLYFNARGSATNDPALSFLSLIEQRDAATADFAPSSLNNPQAGIFETGSLGFDFPIYEGGAMAASSDSAKKMRESRELELEGALEGQFADLAGRYAFLLALESERKNLGLLEGALEETLRHYRIGSPANPVGYSGLLGLKNLKNRILGLLAQNQAQRNDLRVGMSVAARDLPVDWKAPEGDSVEFLDRVFTSEDPRGGGTPAFVKAARTRAEGMEKLKGRETAKCLPRISLFAQGNLANGDRDFAASYDAGLYLRWDLFSAPNFSAGDQAENEALAARDQAEALWQESQTRKNGALESIAALRVSLSLMDDSRKLLEEQTQTTAGLFKNGSINALQWVEVLSRRADLLEARLEAEKNLAAAEAAWAVNSGYPGGVHDQP